MATDPSTDPQSVSEDRWTIYVCGLCGRRLIDGDHQFHLHDAHPETRTQVDRSELIREIEVVPLAAIERSQEARREKNACILHWIDRYEEWRGRAETAEAERDRLAAEVERLKGALLQIAAEGWGQGDVWYGNVARAALIPTDGEDE